MRGMSNLWLDGFARQVTEESLVGQPPMQYLAQWRMQVAANLLAQSGAKIATIGVEVGYDSETAFSRAFKKATGVAPGAWRAGKTGRGRSGAGE
jgi:AraC-like DNA-binding protein